MERSELTAVLGFILVVWHVFASHLFNYKLHFFIKKIHPQKAEARIKSSNISKCTRDIMYMIVFSSFSLLLILKPSNRMFAGIW